MKIIRRIPKEQYGYYEIGFDSLDEYKDNFKKLKKEIEKQEHVEPEAPFITEGSFILNKKGK